MQWVCNGCRRELTLPEMTRVSATDCASGTPRTLRAAGGWSENVWFCGECFAQFQQTVAQICGDTVAADRHYEARRARATPQS